MKARVKWVEDLQFLGESGTGHTIVMDGPEELGGHGTGMRPMELLLLGMGGCTSFDMVQMLKKGRQDIRDCVVEIDHDVVRLHIGGEVRQRRVFRSAAPIYQYRKVV